MTANDKTPCEIRVPTYRRPRLLERALRSVAAQTHTHWQCVVFDDCPEGSARAIVNAMQDARFHYRNNQPFLRAIGNIDQCFRNQPFVAGDYACVVEDDNYLLPDHLATQLSACARQGVGVTFSAQEIEEIDRPGEPGRIGGGRTLTAIYPEGRHSWRTLLPALLVSHAFSNGALFWRLGGSSDFEIGDVTRHPGVQETLRILKLRDDVYISHQATAVWRSNDALDSYVTRGPGVSRLGARWRALSERREINDYRRWYLQRFGIGDALHFVERLAPALAPAMERALLLCGERVALTGRSAGWRIVQIMKGHVFRVLVRPQLDLRRLDEGHADRERATA